MSAMQSPSALTPTTYESVFAGPQGGLLGTYDAEDRYIGSLVGVRYAEAFRSRAPLLVPDPGIFLNPRLAEVEHV